MCSERVRSAAWPRRRGARWAAAGLALAALAGAAACGKKGDPAPPLRFVPQTTDQLTVEQRHLDLVLELPYPKTTAAGMALPGLDRVEVWEVRKVAPRALDEEAEEAAASAAEAGGEAAEGAAADAETAGDEPGGETPEEAGTEEAGTEDAEAEAPAAAGEPASDAAPSSTAPPPLDPREFAATATLRTAIEGEQLSAVVVGDRIVLRLPLPAVFPEVPEAHWLAVRTVVGEDDRSELSNQAVIVPRVPPEAPGGLAAEAQPGGVRLTWRADGPDVVGYDVYRRGAAERLFLDPIARLPAGAGEHFDSTARFGERYIYGVAAVAARDPLVASAIGSTVEVDYRDRFAPAPPAGLVALVEEGRVRLVWEAAEAADLAGYRVERAAGGGAFAAVGEAPAASNEWVDEDVDAGTVYTWRVVSVDDDGNRSAPAEVTAEAR